MESEEGDMVLDSIENGIPMAITSSIAGRLVSLAPSATTSEMTSASASTSIVCSVAAPSTSNPASSAPSTTSALPHRKGTHKRVPPSKKANSKKATSSIKPVPEGPSCTSNASGPSEGAPGALGIPGLVATADSGNDGNGNDPGRGDGPGGGGGGEIEGGRTGGEQDKGSCSEFGGGDEHQDDEGGGGGNYPESPISGLHSMFTLPLSPLFGVDDLPPSRFGSIEPEVARVTPSSSVPITVAGPTQPFIPVAVAGPIQPSVPIAVAGPTQPSVTSPSSVQITIAGPNQPAMESPSVARKRNRPDDNGALEDVGPSTRAKKARTSSGRATLTPTVKSKAKKVASRKSVAVTKTTPSPPTATSDPPWLTSAISMFGAEELGGNWLLLVQAWSGFERKESKQTPSILNSTHRPSVIRDWIQRARSVSYRPAIDSIPDFEKSYMLWWKELQPEWRMSSSQQIAYSEVDGDWDGIRTAGRNGLLSVVAALFFWGVALKKAKKSAQEDKGWKVGIDDCLRVLNALLGE